MKVKAAGCSSVKDQIYPPKFLFVLNLLPFSFLPADYTLLSELDGVEDALFS